MECILYKNPVHWKIRDPFNLRLNNYRKDVNNSKAIPACNHVKTHGRNFMKHVKFTLTEHLRETSNVSEDTLRLRLKRREEFRLLKSKHLLPRD